MDWLKIVSKPALKYGIVAGGLGLSAMLMYQYLNKKQDEIAPEMQISTKVPEIVIDYETDDLLKFPESESDSDRKSIKEPVEVDSLFDDFPEQLKPTRKVLLLGLENSGKSSLLSQLSREASDCGQYQPTQGFNVVCISFDNIDLSIWEIGGSLEYRSYWKNFCTSTNMILFVVDSCDRQKFPEAKKFFYTVFHDLPDDIELHVAATKADRIDSASVEEIQESLGLDGSKVQILKSLLGNQAIHMAVNEVAKKNILLLSAGCFNPITNMHLRIFELARDILQKAGKFNVVAGIISPTHDDYQKLTTKPLISAVHRIEMCRRAVKSSDWIRLSTWESEQIAWTRTRSVLDHFRESIVNRENELIDIPSDTQVKLLCGADMMESFAVPGLWQESDIEAIVGQYGLVVITRAGSLPQDFVQNHDILSKYQDSIHIIDEWIPNEISSTKIRSALNRNQSIKYLVPDPVIDYINANCLYQ